MPPVEGNGTSLCREMGATASPLRRTCLSSSRNGVSAEAQRPGDSPSPLNPLEEPSWADESHGTSSPFAPGGSRAGARCASRCVRHGDVKSPRRWRDRRGAWPRSFEKLRDLVQSTRSAYASKTQRRGRLATEHQRSRSDTGSHRAGRRGGAGSGAFRNRISSFRRA